MQMSVKVAFLQAVSRAFGLGEGLKKGSEYMMV